MLLPPHPNPAFPAQRIVTLTPSITSPSHLSLNRGCRWGTTDDFTTTFLHFSLFLTTLWDLANSAPVHSLMLPSHFFLCLPCLLPPFTDHVTNEEVRAKIQQAIRPHEDLTIVKKCKLQWYGHVSRLSGLAKTILQGTVKGGRRQGRGRGVKTTSGNGQAWSLRSPRGQWRTGKNGENWLQNHLWCPNDPRG